MFPKNIMEAPRERKCVCRVNGSFGQPRVTVMRARRNCGTERFDKFFFAESLGNHCQDNFVTGAIPIYLGSSIDFVDSIWHRPALPSTHAVRPRGVQFSQ